MSAKIGEVILLMWDAYHGWANEPQRNECLAFWLGNSSVLQRYLMTAHGEVSGAEKGGGKVQQPIAKTFIASAFGYEPLQKIIDPARLDLHREAWLDTLINETNKQLKEIDAVADETKSRAKQQAARQQLLATRAHLLAATQSHLEQALGETQRGYNDVTLWDFVSSISTLFKAAAAKAVIENRFVETRDLQWRFLSIRYNGLDYLSRAHHISDLLARRKALDAALDAVQVLIEVEAPLGNEVYRDENGSVLVVPHISVDGSESILQLPAGEGLDSVSLEQELQHRFAAAGREPLAGELVPIVSLSGQVRGKDLRLSEVQPWQSASFADPKEINKIWQDVEKRGELCSVCGVRPQGYGAPQFYWDEHLRAHRAEKDTRFCQVCKAQSRSLCHVCMERRDERSKDWATKAEEFKQTIWINEVADGDGRLALIAGRFELDGWLSGQLIPTMMKDASFARVRRCWETTRKFWRDIEEQLPSLSGGQRQNRLALIPDAPLTELGPYHVYELKLNERYLSVVCAPHSVASAQSCLLTAENLDYAQRLAAVDDLRAYLEGRSCELYEASGYGQQLQSKGAVKIKRALPAEEELRYAPAITILSEPALYLALAPADRALDVARYIKEKYEREMARVRDRLAVQVGLVFAPRRTPMRALLEAGQRMLKLPLTQWAPWPVTSAPTALTDQGCRQLTFANGVTWDVPVKMGDYDSSTGQGTTDNWYPHFLTREPTTSEDLSTTKPWQHVQKLEVGDEVVVRPSRFDFALLDTTGRRLEISYNAAGRRRGLPTRPLLLEQLGTFDALWRALVGGARKLGKSQLQNFEGAVIERVAAWHGGDWQAALRDPVWQQFTEDTLHRLDGGWWKSLLPEQRQDLERAARDGTLLDLLDLRMHILKEPREKPNKENQA